MDREELVEYTVAYEKTHPVEDYRVCGWRVWPHLRIEALCAGGALICDPSSPARRVPEPEGPHSRGRLCHTPGGTPSPGGLAAKLSKTFQSCAWWSGLVSPDRGKSVAPDAPGRDVAIFTHTSRQIRRRSACYHYIAAPLAELLEAKGLRCLVWEAGPPLWPRQTPSAWISHHLDVAFHFACLAGRVPRAQPPPPWFRDYARWAGGIQARRSGWPECERLIRYVSTISQVFGKWLRASGCRLLVVDCWYPSVAMAATLAASRLKIPVVEFQHGLQGAASLAYSHWEKAPADGWETMPGYFWVWGQEDAERIVRTNRALASPDRAIVGGNLWINKWRGKVDLGVEEEARACREMAKGRGKSVLVTLQKGVEFRTQLFRAISESPRDWLWMVRLHPRMLRELNAIEGELRSLGHPGVNVRGTSALPLYPLLQTADVHVTWFSTCSIEALVFGVPTVLLHSFGCKTFRRHVDAGVMAGASTAEEILGGIRLLSGVPRSLCRKEADAVFAPPQTSEKAIATVASLCEKAGERGGQPGAAPSPYDLGG